VDVSLAHKEVFVRYDDARLSEVEVKDTLRDLGYTIRDPDKENGTRNNRRNSRTASVQISVPEWSSSCANSARTPLGVDGDHGGAVAVARRHPGDVHPDDRDGRYGFAGRLTGFQERPPVHRGVPPRERPTVLGLGGEATARPPGGRGPRPAGDRT